MHYNITQDGRSTLRNITNTEQSILESTRAMVTSPSNHHPNNNILGPLIILLHGISTGEDESSSSSSMSSSSALDKAHEMILGVNRTNIDQAEYAATHPGKTRWSRDHPLTAEQDMLHSILHRLEGWYVGEGGHRGYENAKYWLVGGGKMLDAVEHHPVREKLKEYILERSFMQDLNLIVGARNGDGEEEKEEEEGREYDIIAGGGTVRKVFVKKGEFDFFLFCDLCQKRYEHSNHHAPDGGGRGHGCDDSINYNGDDWKDEWQEIIDLIQIKEFELLLRYAKLELHVD